MSDAIEVFEDMAAFASLREPGWHQLGTVFNKPVTTEEMLDLAHLSGWNVRLVPVVSGMDMVKDYYYVVRTNPFTGQDEVLHIAGGRYTVYQNEQLFDFGAALGDGARWETAGSIKKGTVVFGSLSIEREVILDESGANDKINNYLVVTTSHNGTSAIQAAVTPVRVVCSNTLNFALANTKQSFKMRHTQRVEGKVEEARKALNLAHQYVDNFETLANTLYQTPVSDEKFWDIVKAAYPEPDKDATPAAITRWDNKATQLAELWKGQTNANIANTAWGALNTLTERFDWYRGGRGENKEENLNAARSGFDPISNTERNRLLKVVRGVVMA